VPEGSPKTLSSSTAYRWVGLPCAPDRLRAGRFALRVGLLIGCLLAATEVQAQIELPPADPDEPIVISARRANRWRQGQYDVWLLGGECTIHQGANRCRSRDAVLWIKRDERTPAALPDEGEQDEQAAEPPQHKVIAYLEGNVQIEAGRREQTFQQPRNVGGERGWLGRFHSRSLQFRTPRRPGPEPPLKPTVYQNGMAARDPDAEGIRRTQFTANGADPAPTALPPAPLAAPPGQTLPEPSVAAAPVGRRRIQFFPRSSVPPQASWIPNPARDEGVLTIKQGVQIFISGLGAKAEHLDIQADSAVIWTVGSLADDLQEKYQDDNVPLEVYLEGHVVFRQGDRVIYADRMFYDVANKNGTIVDSDIFTPAPKFGGLMRLKSQLVRIAHGDTFYAQNSFFTSSRLGKPRFRVQAHEVFVEDHQIPEVDPDTGVPELDADSQEPVIKHDQTVTAKHNFFFVGPVPVFYWPRFSTNLDQPSTVIQNAYVQPDRIFGVWTEADFNAFQLLGLGDKRPEGMNWTLQTSDLTKRGLGGGTTATFNRPMFLGLGSVTANFKAWGLHDKGRDVLGYTRNGVIPETRDRGRVFGQFRQQLPKNYQLTGELGYISDLNFLEQYYEAEWDQNKDETTDLELKHIENNRSWSVYSSVRLNPFFTETNWFPRLEHYTLGQSLLGETLGERLPWLRDRLTWYEHTNVGYAQYRVIQKQPASAYGTVPFQWLPWELNSLGQPANVQGQQLVSRQEVDAPIDLGPFKFSPYAMGELASWGQDLNGNQFNRAWGQAGLRGSIPFWTANSAVENSLLNVHGIAHKAVFEFDASASDTNKRMTALPLYDPLDDNSQEHYRRRFAFLDYGGTTPFQFDPRSYALRSGLQNWVSSPVSEIADRLDAVRFGLRQRWQTKRGPPGHRRIIDWIVLNTGAVYFPNPNRDNFGQPIGLANFDFRWHVGDRLTLLSDGMYDFFPQAEKTFTVTGSVSQSPRLNWNVSFRTISGPFNYNYMTVTHTYMLSPKWMYTAGTSIALGNQNIGQNIAVTRIGESFVANVAFYVDNSKNNYGFNAMISPRFLGQQALRRIGGAAAPQQAMMGLQ